MKARVKLLLPAAALLVVAAPAAALEMRPEHRAWCERNRIDPDRCERDFREAVERCERQGLDLEQCLKRLRRERAEGATLEPEDRERCEERGLPLATCTRLWSMLRAACGQRHISPRECRERFHRRIARMRSRSVRRPKRVAIPAKSGLRPVKRSVLRLQPAKRSVLRLQPVKRPAPRVATLGRPTALRLLPLRFSRSAVNRLNPFVRRFAPASRPTKLPFRISRWEPPKRRVKERPAKQPVTLRVRRKDVSGKHHFEVVINASGYINRRLLDYLGQELEIRRVKLPQRTEMKTLRRPGARIDRAADEITVELRATSPGTDASQFHYRWPDGFQLARAGVLKVRPSLTQAAALTGTFRLNTSVTLPSGGVPTKPPVRAGAGLAVSRGALTAITRLRGRLQCRAPDGPGKTVTHPLRYLKVKLGSSSATTNATGDFLLEGSFTPGPVKLTIDYEGPISAGRTSGSSRLQIMGDVHQTHWGDVHGDAVSTSGSEAKFSGGTLTSVDCELWRIGVNMLEDYHKRVGKSPPAGELRIKRWSGIYVGTPHTFYDYVVLKTDFTSGDYNTVWARENTMYHEFGHSIRHVADGDYWHWNWDMFRWAYARTHSGCEVTNTQYAFNEGFGNYWTNLYKKGVPPCTVPGGGYLDWNETRVGERLRALSDASSPRKIVEVLENNRDAIHSLWGFEEKYCQAVSLPNKYCRANRTPQRAKPSSCPPNFHDDGATCRLDNIRAKPSYGRGVGVVPTDCGPGRQLQAGLCYPNCRGGYHGVGPVCWQNCPAGFPDHGAFCGKPAPYGRGAGYPWKFGDALNLDAARRRCERDHGTGRCEQNGLLIYPKCRAGFHAVGCCVCSPNCQAGMVDIGVSCAKKSYGRGVGLVPTKCQGGMQYDAGLCYKPCKRGFRGVGPVCWGSCPAGYDDHGATCYQPPNVLVKY